MEWELKSLIIIWESNGDLKTTNIALIFISLIFNVLTFFFCASFAINFNQLEEIIKETCD